MREVRRRHRPAWTVLPGGGASPVPAPPVLRWGLLVAILLFAGVNAAVAVAPRAVQTARAQNDILISPAAWAFSIWGVIFLGLIIFGGYQVAARRAQDPRLAGVRLPMLISTLVGAAWPLVAWPVLTARGNEVAAWALLLVMFGSTVEAYLALGDGRVDWRENLGVRWPIGLYLGWLTIAALLSTGLVASHVLGLQGLLLPGRAWAQLAVVLAGGLGLAAGLYRRDGAFCAAVAWGLVAIAVRQPDLGLRLLCGLAVAAMGVGLLAGRRRIRAVP